MLQQWIAQQILELFPHLSDKDVKSTPMGAHGVDVWLSEAAYKLLPWSIEAKNQEKFRGVYNAYEQAVSQDHGEPVVILKQNHEKPLAVVDALYLLKLMQDNDTENRE